MNSTDIDFKLYPEFPALMNESDSAILQDMADEIDEDGDFALIIIGPRTLVYAVDDGTYLMPEWVTKDQVEKLFYIKKKAFAAGYDRGYERGKQHERQQVQFYAKLINGTGSTDFTA